MSENNEASVESNCFRGGFTLKASRLGGAVLRPAVLGPSVLGSSAQTNSSNNSSTSLAGNNEKSDDENISNNPFLREDKDEGDEDSAAGAAAPVVAPESSTEKPEQKDDEEVDERPDPLTKLRSNGIERSSMFGAAKTNMPHVQTTGYVFGQNVHERVVGVGHDGHAAAAVPGSSSENTNTDQENVEAAATTSQSQQTQEPSSSSQLLFSSVIQKAAQSTDSSEAASSSSSSNNNKSEAIEAKSLTDVAREYEESRAQKRKYEEVETFTGEEDELNIVDVSCKLFAFVNSNWEERGRGSLRLNDVKGERDCSRVVFRTSGNLRLLLNTKVWAAMVAERASPKSLRLTAIDNSGSLKIFLAMGRPADIAQLHKSLCDRIARRKLTHPEECSVEDTKNGVASEAAASLQPESTTHDDDDDEAAAVVVAPTTTAAVAEADSMEPSPKKVLVQQPDSSDDVRVPAMEVTSEEVDAAAEAEAKESSSTDQN
ncbi:ran-binding protein 3 [Drosophila subobscura]|uniref:ran-binding protein 3 n=1 Tax=Drosophila subobscura TaxID=7241 RepID=UPI00155A2891|nr:ran-binding protein 3 [Drosophila subobscura]XP_034663826.1 ran-binding protein 3 [Drosophila subobscura]